MSQYSKLAQLVEQSAVNRPVVGSSPTLGAKKYFAILAQLVEHLFCSQDVVGSIPTNSSKRNENFFYLGDFSEWSKEADCKSVGLSVFVGSNPSIPTVVS